MTADTPMSRAAKLYVDIFMLALLACVIIAAWKISWWTVIPTWIGCGIVLPSYAMSGPDRAEGTYFAEAVWRASLAGPFTWSMAVHSQSYRKLIGWS